MKTRNLLFVCSRNRLRSPTAEQIFAGRSDCVVASAGTDHDADEPVTAAWLAWADIVFVMERKHRTKLRRRHGTALKSARLICLDIADDDGFTDPELVRLLESKVTPHLR